MSRLATRDAALRPARSVPVGRRYRDASPSKVVAWPAPSDWTERAACAGEDPQLWDATPETGSGQSARELAVPALAICATCPVRRECRELGDSLPRVARINQIFGGHLYTHQAPALVAYTPCAGDCGHLLRPARTTRYIYPDTRIHVGRNLCAPCWKKDTA